MFYELSVRAFHDGNNDGIGDFAGLIGKLEYLEWLGVDCIWLLPFQQSPLRDGGYDISDYRMVLPDYGTVEDVALLVEEAHRRGIRVIMDLVINHTSDQHPWFRSARSSPDSEYRDWYMWSSTKNRFTGARIIFVDTETSNWTWDDDAGAYYFHRFFSHQPDLNYDNPQVRAEIIDVCRFWLDLGMDGFRLDAVPYLFKREGTNCENLPETHAFLAELRAAIDAEYPDKVLLAEANQWPEDVVDYFGSPDRPECHMCFNFPLMPRMFMGLRREQRYPITEILDRTPALPPNSQWGIFLRNHDELTLEMVTDEERDYMWGEYAKDPRAKLNLGIRRRLAPLLNNGRRQMELFHGLILSLPGQPDPLLRRRDRHGGQRLPRGSRRRSHPDAVDRRQQRRFQPGRFRAAVSASADGPGLWLPGVQRERAAPQRVVDAALAAPLHRGSQALSRVRRRKLRGASTRPTRRCSPSCAAWMDRRCSASTTSRDSRNRSSSTCASTHGTTPVEMLGRVHFPQHRRAAVPVDHGPARLLLVHAGRPGRHEHAAPAA